MKHLFLDKAGRLRNGWWILIFAALMLASRALYTPLSRALQQLGATPDWLDPLRFGSLLLVTWVCLHLRKERLGSVGFVLDWRWAREFGGGSLLGLASALLVTALIAAVGGVWLELDPARSVGLLFKGAYVFLFVALFEETLFRGFVFQRLVDGIGVWAAQIVLALLFASGHWGNPDMQGATLAWATLDLFLGAVLFGLAYLRTRSLALPVGLHLGWNWTQGYLLGFGVSGYEHHGWFRPVLADLPEWISGGRFGLEASVFSVVLDVLLILLLWRWKGRSGSTAEATANTALTPANAAVAAAR